MKIKILFYKLVSTVEYLRSWYVYHTKINDLLKKTSSNQQKDISNKEIKRKFTKYGFNNISLKWHNFYNSFHDNYHEEYIPELLFYTKIEPSLNNTIMFPALEDKNLLDNYIDLKYLPKTIFKNINGFYYIGNQQTSIIEAIKACLKFDEFVIKPTIGTFGGKGVRKIDLKSEKDKNNFLKLLFKKYKVNFIVQEVIQQHEELSKLNQSSINTIRAISYMNSDIVVTLSSVIRIGQMNQFVDSLTLGGIACGISEDGKLHQEAKTEEGNKAIYTNSGVPFESITVPQYAEIIKTISIQHKNIPHFRLISWDIAIDINSDIKIIEFNALGQDINMHQIINGPLFGDYFNEILEISSNYNTIKESNDV